jgi:hypothetical protein
MIVWAQPEVVVFVLTSFYVVLKEISSFLMLYCCSFRILNHNENERKKGQDEMVVVVVVRVSGVTLLPVCLEKGILGIREISFFLSFTLDGLAFT